MEKRYFLALLLAAAVVAITQFLFPVASPVPPADTKRDTVSSAVTPKARVQETPAPIADQLPVVLTDSVGAMDIRPEITAIETRRSVYQFSNIGAAPTSVRLKSYENLTPSGGFVELRAPGEPLLKYGLVHRGDTVSLARVPFRVSREGDPANGGALVYSAAVDNFNVTIRYGFVPDRYMVSVNGQIDGPTENVYLLTQLPSTLRPTESDTTGDLNSLAYSFKPERDNARLVQFGSLDPGEQELAAGPLTWAAVKNKYFVLGVLNPAGSTFDEISLKGGPRTSKLATTASATIVKAIKGRGFSMDLYAGPQQQNELIAAGREFDNVNPFGWRFLQGMVQPIATLCIRLLLWMHEVLQLSYGWVLVIFGVLIRIILWPLNQSAMRSSMKMQDIQPRLAEVQKKYKDKPERQREEIMKVYKEHGASPFTALTGCLPALIPMPVLFALFFVFQGTIEFRGVPFMWLHDISLKDPFYILPVLMGASMYVLSWIGLRNAPPNPQAKMMSYMFPVMMTFVLANMASGLNLYYTAQNLAALPQQWLLARERARRKRLT
jgi:YidC/Oxa1 family membrane protein insertase